MSCVVYEWFCSVEMKCWHVLIVIYRYQTQSNLRTGLVVQSRNKSVLLGRYWYTLLRLLLLYLFVNVTWFLHHLLLYLSGLQNDQSHWSIAYFILENSTKYVKMRLSFLKDWKLLKMFTTKRIQLQLVEVKGHIMGLQRTTVWSVLKDVKLLLMDRRISILLWGIKTLVAVGFQEDQKLLCGCSL